MRTIFSILYIPISATLDERVSIGLIMSDGKHHFFKYSHSKLQAIKGLLSNESYLILKTYLKSLEKDIKSTGENTDCLFSIDIASKAKWVNHSYISYLSKYSNNLIQFSEPKFIDVALSNDTYRRVFEKYIFEYDEHVHLEDDASSVYQNIKAKLYPKITGKVNIDRILTSDDFANLFAPVEVNFIGVNGVPVAGQVFDFEKRHYNLENDISRFISLTKAIELSGQKEGKYFVLGREPQTKPTDKNHIMWAQIRDAKFLDFVDIDEVGIVEEYIEKNQVTPFFEEPTE
ncbi:hypothetical protein [Flavobacterium granuli]|uniref:DUF3037 domain-containing protein n=1 Tax=Flavobacterium granuli TaxID=280093 RepID=A0A1M5UD59_9FLAO|nr:hypothetical protein [Flavobacterium granuli]PRZ19127.1 hypothetical protein BC624_1224 [Flavobacterium granuli]SHH60995.1 hypothetical protein SAMN05443373_1244 [Flavobacterium granuli]